MNVFLGVSLGSRKFSRRFFSALPDYVERLGGRNLLVVIFDHGEIINYTAVNGYDIARATAVASRRQAEVRCMVAKALGRHSRTLDWRVCASSDMEELGTTSATAENILRRVVNQSSLGPVLACESLKRLARLALIDDVYERRRRAAAASDYLIQEAAWSWAFFTRYRIDVEVYPGRVQWLKDDLLHGRLPGAEALALRAPPAFIDCESLCRQRAAVVSAGHD